MDSSERPGAADRPYSGGLLGLFGARGSFTRRFERVHLLRRFREALPAALSVFYVLSALFQGATRIPFRFRAEGWLWWLAAPAVMLLGACLAGVRSFAGERGRGTAEALVLTPLSRRELVGGRFLTNLRPYFGFALLFAFITMFLIPFPPRDRWGDCPGGNLGALGIGLTYCFFYFSLVALGAALGLWAGLRVRHSWAAGAAAAGCLAAVAGFELVVLAALGFLFVPLIAFGSLAFLAGLNLLAASSIVQWTVRSFDRLAIGER